VISNNSVEKIPASPLLQVKRLLKNRHQQS